MYPDGVIAVHSGPSPIGLIRKRNTQLSEQEETSIQVQVAIGAYCFNCNLSSLKIIGRYW